MPKTLSDCNEMLFVSVKVFPPPFPFQVCYLPYFGESQSTLQFYYSSLNVVLKDYLENISIGRAD